MKRDEKQVAKAAGHHMTEEFRRKGADINETIGKSRQNQFKSDGHRI